MLEMTCDVLVVGGGAAGSRAAYEAKKLRPELRVVVAVAGKYGTSGSSNLVASESLGINAPFNYAGDGDTPATYLEDMLATGGGLSDPELCRIISEEACLRVEELMALGLRFDAQGDLPIQRKLSGCTKARSLTCGGSTGREMVRVLKEAGAALGVEVLEGTRILQLLQDEEGRVVGALALRSGELLLVRAGAVVLATGGAGRIFRQNVNPPTLEGDGWVMAYHAGARLVNMEFFQVGPAVLAPKIMFIIHSHMWRLQPKLTNSQGEEFLGRYCPPGVSPEEVIEAKAMSYPFSVRTVAKYLDIAIFKEIMAGRATPAGGVYFDVRHVGEKRLREAAPITYETLKRAGADLAHDVIELGLAVQNFNGGVLIDAQGFTGVPGLYAAGEVTGGVHGSDRPGGNNLTDTQVFGYRAGRAAAEWAAAQRDRRSCVSPAKALQDYQRALTEEERRLIDEAADLFYRELTIVRHKGGLERVLAFAEEASHPGRHPLVGHRLLAGSILALAALTREESRGTHYREDYPHTEPAWNRRIEISRGSDGRPVVNARKMS